MIKSVLESFGMRQHIAEPTHVAGHILDLVISRDTYDTLSDFAISDPGFPDSSGNILRDHFSVVFYARAAKPASIRKTVQFRKLKSINISNFKEDIISSSNIQKAHEHADTDTLVEIYNNELAAILDKPHLCGLKPSLSVHRALGLPRSCTMKNTPDVCLNANGRGQNWPLTTKYTELSVRM